jgi:hypothetical protein
MSLFNLIFNSGNKGTSLRPRWRPQIRPDSHLVLEKAGFYLNQKFQLAVFAFGTVVYFKNHVNEIDNSAKQIISNLNLTHPDFTSSEMEDGNFIVEFNEPAFNIVFRNEIDLHWQYIEKNHLNGLCKNEVLINKYGERNTFDKIGKIALFGRARMFMDIQYPKIVETFNPLT